jgi:tetratricopeptide (TPR) repeat protein
MDNNESELLHEQASSYYLEGDIDAALATWRRLLEADPADDRAREGVDLCERMTGCESESVVTAGQSPFAVGGSNPPEFEEHPPLDEPQAQDVPPRALDDSLDQLLDLGPAVPRPGKQAAAPGAEQADDSDGVLDLSELREEADAPATEEFGFGEMFDAPEPARSAAPPAAEEAETTWHFGFGPPEPEPMAEAAPEPAVEVVPPADPPSEETGGTSAANLHRRASDLLATALGQMESGEKQDALQTLEQLLILDEQNFAARSLAEKLQTEIDGGQDLPPEGVSQDEPLDLGAGESLELDTDAIPAVDDALAQDLPGEEPVPVNPIDLESGAEEPAAPPASSKRRFSIPDRKIWVPAALVLALGAGYLVWSLFLTGGDGVAEPSESPGRQARGSQAGQETENAAEPEQPAAGEGGTAVEAEAPTVEQQLAAALARAEEALGAANYAAAVIALDEALVLAPNDLELRARLDAAGESYRVQQEKQARWDQAVHHFDQGEYETALAFFYRMPADEQTERLEIYKLAGWYNLGVMALKNRDCRQALEHFREAREIAPRDPGLDEADALARQCAREGVAVTRTAVNGLEFRRLEALR